MQIEWGTKAIRDMRRLAAQEMELIIAKIEQYAGDPGIACQAGERTDWERLQAIESRQPPCHFYY